MDTSKIYFQLLPHFLWINFMQFAKFWVAIGSSCSRVAFERRTKKSVQERYLREREQLRSLAAYLISSLPALPVLCPNCCCSSSSSSPSSLSLRSPLRLPPPRPFVDLSLSPLCCTAHPEERLIHFFALLFAFPVPVARLSEQESKTGQKSSSEMACVSAVSVTLTACVVPVAAQVSGTKSTSLSSGKSLALASSSPSKSFASKLNVNNKSRVTMRFVFLSLVFLSFVCFFLGFVYQSAFLCSRSSSSVWFVN